MRNDAFQPRAHCRPALVQILETKYSSDAGTSLIHDLVGRQAAHCMSVFVMFPLIERRKTVDIPDSAGGNLNHPQPRQPLFRAVIST